MWYTRRYFQLLYSAELPTRVACYFLETKSQGVALIWVGSLIFFRQKFKRSFGRGIFEAVFSHFYQNIVLNDQTFPLQLIFMYLGVPYLDGVGKYFFQKMYGGRLFGRGRQFGTVENFI